MQIACSLLFISISLTQGVNLKFSLFSTKHLALRRCRISSLLDNSVSQGKPPYSIRLPVIPWLEARNGLRGDEISVAESKRVRTQGKRRGERETERGWNRGLGEGISGRCGEVDGYRPAM